MSSRSSPSTDASHAGYLVVPDVFGEDELAALRDAADRAVQTMVVAARSVDEDRSTDVWADGHRLQEVDGTTVHWEPDAPDVVRSLSPVTHLDPRLAALWADPRLTGPACEVLGVSEVAPLHSALNVKKAGVGSEYRWHQDNLELGSTNVVVFLDDARPDNGPLQLLPGSHRAGRLPLDPDDPIERFPDPSLIDDSNGTVVTVGAGSVVVFSALVVHRSDANRSDADRRALRLCYRTVTP